MGDVGARATCMSGVSSLSSGIDDDDNGLDFYAVGRVDDGENRRWSAGGSIGQCGALRSLLVLYSTLPPHTCTGWQSWTAQP